MKLNHLADWFDEEYDTILGLEHPENSEEGDIPNYPITDEIEPIDWRVGQAVTAVRDRSKWISPETGEKMYCASSYAVVTAEVLEGYYLKTKGKLVPLSVQQISDCSSNESIMSKTGTGMWNYGCSGGYLENAFNYATEYEVYDEATYIY